MYTQTDVAIKTDAPKSRVITLGQPIQHVVVDWGFLQNDLRAQSVTSSHYIIDIEAIINLVRYIDSFSIMIH